MELLFLSGKDHIDFGKPMCATWRCGHPRHEEGIGLLAKSSRW
ncbi:hypothetical protein BRPE64_ECDS02430 (plasmid) [Caballeronia insecticola]|uniref:Uncharacterized protein n=1 Tax=Caballeronia insecticola TaxID=758793 RepID=A0A060PRQ0_9BURK|nr:hypothetical protein BRPE64_ECDS02430 [Caballeronia insecticola]